MRKLLLVILFVVQLVYAQESGDYRFGIKIGPNFSYLITYDNSPTGFEGPYTKLGICVGFIVDKTINEFTSFQAELIYNMVGSQWGKMFLEFSYEGNYVIYDLHYLSVPLYFKFKSNIGSILKDFDFMAGAVYSYNLRAEQDVYIEEEYPVDYGPTNIRDEVNHHELGIIAGIKIPSPGRKFALSIHYYWALTDLFSDPTVVYPHGLRHRDELINRNFSVSIEYFIF